MWCVSFWEARCHLLLEGYVAREKGVMGGVS